MITKFERKVIAGLTAFLMCLSMIFAVPVSVNAEAERTQDEAVSGVQQNETVKDVQIPDGMSENVPHDIIAGDEAGDVPHDITVGDEASEKVQQDTVEAGGAAKEKADQPTAPYEEETRTPQMLNVDQQEEVAGTITLKKDGTPEYGEVAFSTEQTMVRYRLNIEEDGQYYFGLIKDWNVSAYVSLFERTDEGDNYLSNESYSYELRKDGNYYLEIEKSSEEALETLKWYAGKVRDIKPGEFEAELCRKSTHNRRERPVHGHRGGSRGRFYYRITTFEGRPWDARDPYKITFMALKHEIRLSIWRKQKETPGVEKAPGVSSPQRKESGRSGRDDGELRFWVRPGHPYKAVTSISQAEALAHGLTHLHHLVFAAVLARELDWCAALQDAREDARPWGVVGIGLRSDVWVEVRRDDHRPAVLVT